MESKRIVILPGLDGTDLLLARFVELVPTGYTASVLALPDNPADDYESLTDSLARQLSTLAPCHLVAESFSGPLGIKLASRHPEMVDRLTLVASFCNSPAPWMARWLPWSLIFRAPLPLSAAQFFFVGSDREWAVRLQDAIGKTSKATMVERLHCVLNVNVSSELTTLRCPIKYLRATHDRLVRARSLRKILNANRNVEIIEIDGPHLILQTRPTQAWLAITGSDERTNSPITNG